MKYKFLYIIILLGWIPTLWAQHKSIQIPDSIVPSNYLLLAEKIVSHLENNGYPFATISLQAADPENGDFSPKLVIDSNVYVTFDSIVIKGNVKLSSHFLYPYLGLKKGMPYNEQLMRSVAPKLEELPFATQIHESGVAFIKNKAYLYLYLDKRQTNHFDGYIGLIPTNPTTNKTAIQGELNLSLQNLFRLGENISLQWHSNDFTSQYLSLSTKFPYLFRTRFGINASFLLDKIDSSYLTTNVLIGIPYSFVNNSYIMPYFNYVNSTILNKELLRFDSDTSCIDYTKTLYGLQARYRKLDYLFNPRKGFDFSVKTSVNSRQIHPNSQVDQSNYDTMILHKTNYTLQGDFYGYIPVGKHFTIIPKLQVGTLLAGPHYYNELFKISGEGKIRGFRHDEILASTYMIYALEVRYLFAKRSYIHLFFDGGTYEQQLQNKYTKDTPFGFGAGINIAVKSGIFYFEYALGRQKGNPISFKTGVIHFGIKVDF